MDGLLDPMTMPRWYEALQLAPTYSSEYLDGPLRIRIWRGPGYKLAVTYGPHILRLVCAALWTDNAMRRVDVGYYLADKGRMVRCTEAAHSRARAQALTQAGRREE